MVSLEAVRVACALRLLDLCEIGRQSSLQHRRCTGLFNWSLAQVGRVQDLDKGNFS